MNAFPPMPPFFPSQHRLPGHGTAPAREQRHRSDAIIWPLEAQLARRIFHIRAEPAPPVAAAQPPCPAADDEPSPNLLARAVARVLRALLGAG